MFKLKLTRTWGFDTTRCSDYKIDMVLLNVHQIVITVIKVSGEWFTVGKLISWHLDHVNLPLNLSKRSTQHHSFELIITIIPVRTKCIYYFISCFNLSQNFEIHMCVMFVRLFPKNQRKPLLIKTIYM